MIHNTPEVNWKFEYVGDIIFRNGYPNRILTDTGHIDMTVPSPYAYCAGNPMKYVDQP